MIPFFAFVLCLVAVAASYIMMLWLLSRQPW